MGIWIEDSIAFERSDELKQAVRTAGHRFVEWQQEWLTSGLPEYITHEKNLFAHLALADAHDLFQQQPPDWTPGVLCDASAFACTSWYKDFLDVLIHETWHTTTVRNLVEHTTQQLGCILDDVSPETHYFVRPNSALKPFAGRVLSTAQTSYARLDHGFYYDDPELEVIIAPVRQVGEEWRAIVVGHELVSMGGYDGASRSATGGSSDKEVARAFVLQVIDTKDLSAFGSGVALDVARVDGQWRVMELNPLSGASLYGCDLNAVVSALMG